MISQYDYEYEYSILELGTVRTPNTLLIAGAWVGLRPLRPLLRPVLLVLLCWGLPPAPWYFPGRTARSELYIMYRINPKPFSNPNKSYYSDYICIHL